MEYRKLQKTGGSSLTLTLPKKWVKVFGLKDKDKVKITSDSGILFIYPLFEKKSSLRSVLNVDNLKPKMILRELIARYISGADEILIQSKQITINQRKEIRSFFQILVGFEIIDESATKIVVKNIFDSSKFPIPKSIEKMFHISKLMIKDANKALFSQDKALARDVIDRDFEVDKLYLTNTRQFNILMRNKSLEEEFGINTVDLYYFEDIAKQLERIADHAVKMATIVITNAKTYRSNFASPSKTNIEEIEYLMDQAWLMVKNQDNNLANKILDTNESIVKNISLYKKLLEGGLLLQIIIGDSLDRIRGYILNMAEVTIDHNASKETR